MDERRFTWYFLILVVFLGLSMTWSFSTGIFLIIAFSYIRILHASVKRGRSDSSAQSKALRTCAPHLVVYLLFEIASLIIIVSYRFPSVSQNIKKFCSILFIIIPPVINPIIYGLVSKELRGSIIKQFITHISLKKWKVLYPWLFPELFKIRVECFKSVYNKLTSITVWPDLIWFNINKCKYNTFVFISQFNIEYK